MGCDRRRIRGLELELATALKSGAWDAVLLAQQRCAPRGMPWDAQ